MKSALAAAWRVASSQGTGIAAQIAFGAPSIAASLVLARFDALRLVADLALAFGLASTVFTAASFNLSQYLALWGLRHHAAGTLWRNRLVAASLAMLAVAGLLWAMGAAPAMIALATLVKGTDAFAELRLGLAIHDAGAGIAMRQLLRWSVLRLAVMALAVGIALAAGMTGRHALLAGAAAQALTGVPWRTLGEAVRGPGRWSAAYDVARETWPLSVAATACGLLTTAPRLLAERVASADDLGYFGIVFMASTLIGMSFNVAWYRLAALFREQGRAHAVRRYLRAGGLLAGAVYLGLLLGTPLVARVYGITDARFGRLFPAASGVFVLFYFAMSLANLLKTSRIRFLEAATYVIAAVGLAGAGVATSSLLAGVATATAVLVVVTLLGLRTPDGARD
jgi:hypothetical protein